MNSLLDYPSQRLTALISRDPMVAKTHKTFNKVRRDEAALIEQLIIDQAKIIQKLKDEILTLQTCTNAVGHIAKASETPIKKFLT